MEPDGAALDAALTDLGEAWWLLERPSPAALDRCSEILDAAAHRLYEWRARGTPGRRTPEAIAKARALCSAVRGAGRLLANAACYHERWIAVRNGLSAGYTASGASAQPPHSARVSFRG